MFIGRALYVGGAISDRYMLIIPDSLMEWLHLSKRPLYRYLTDLHWCPIGADDIGYDQICRRFGRQIFFEATWFNLTVQFRNLRIGDGPPAEHPSPPPSPDLSETIVEELLQEIDDPTDSAVLDDNMLILRASGFRSLVS
jgi:hypothetical protein